MEGDALTDAPTQLASMIRVRFDHFCSGRGFFAASAMRCSNFVLAPLDQRAELAKPLLAT